MVATLLVAALLAAIESAGFGPGASVELVPQAVRQRLMLAMGVLIFAVGVGGSLRIFGMLQDREVRLAEAAREQHRLYQESLRQGERLRELSRKLMEVSEDTMRRVARELHDDLGQAITAVRLDLAHVDRSLPLAQWREAFEAMQRGEIVGKIVLQP